MLRTGNRLSLILWGIPLLAACSVAQTNVFQPGMQVMGPSARRAPAPVPTPAVPVSAPAAPVSMSQLPAAAPQVSYQGGMLTIVAQNSNLGDILREVHRLTGATIDVPANATERVVTRVGPGPARDVLADLLNGSAFNYVMLGTASDPASLASVMLTMKPAGTIGTQTAANVYQPPPQTYAVQQGVNPPGTGPGGPVVQQPASDEEADAEDKDEDDSGEEAQAPQNGATPADGSQPNAGPKTPEQILEMLRQRQGQMTPGQQLIPKPTPPDDNNN